MAIFDKKVPILKLDYSDEDIKFILNGIEQVLKSGFLTMSDRVEEFEHAFAKFCGVKYAVGTNSGTSSLEIIMRAIDVSQGTVVMPSNTYMATPLSAIKAGAKDEKEALRWLTKDLGLTHIQDYEHFVWEKGFLFTDYGRELVKQLKNIYLN